MYYKRINKSIDRSQGKVLYSSHQEKAIQGVELSLSSNRWQLFSTQIYLTSQGKADRVFVTAASSTPRTHLLLRLLSL